MLGRWIFPIWALIFSKCSHLLLVINSSINCLIYCLLSSKFRKVAAQKARKWGCLKDRANVIIEDVAQEPLNPKSEVRFFQNLNSIYGLLMSHTSPKK